MGLFTTLPRRRRAAGLSQQALARQVGVSRQALAAIEAGRQTPSTALALRLAAALRCKVEDLFALAESNQLEAQVAAGAGARVILGRVDARWVAHGVGAAQAADGLRRLPGSADPAGTELVEPLTRDAHLVPTTLLAGCAPLLGVLADRATLPPTRRVHWLPADSGHALDLLAADLVHIAGLHLADDQRPDAHAAIVRARLPETPCTLIRLTRWRQGLVVAPDNQRGIAGVDDLARSDVRLVRRSAGAAAQRLLERHLGAPTPPTGPLARDHAEVARLIRWGVADAGVAIEAAAVAEALTFLPLADEAFDLVIPNRHLAEPGVRALLNLLESGPFRAEAAHLVGYDLSTTGHAVEVRP